ncbi:MAG TPA: DUF2268 domain-containing putative Zn-dependent protease [Chthoniobacterales bacterium]
MRSFWLLLYLASFAFALPGQTPDGVKTVDLLPGFRRCLDDLPADPVRSSAAFRRWLQAAEPDVCRHLSSLPADPAGWSAYLAEARRLLPVMVLLSRRCMQVEPEVVHRLQQRFPDFDPARVELTLGFSLFRFDARIPYDHPTQLWLGLDGIASAHGAECRLDVLLAHEMFHVYHFQNNPQPNAGRSVPLYRQVWQEGLACYVARQLYPEASPADVFLDPNLAATGPRYVATTARALLDDLQTDDDAATSRYLAYHVSTGALPARMGYLLGYDVVSRCAVTQSLAQLSRLRGENLLRLMQKELHGLIQAPPAVP